MIDLRDNAIVEVDALAGVDWVAPENTCAMLLLTGNPLSAAAKQQLPAMCDATGVSFQASGLECITDACIPPPP
ncbi:hypothetical protein OV079_16210 [Nannocystis pusilla]|uniref:Uncharacterized protein n=1 Tax=Nannocystis pusilla TaxID=889268 RepID=A0A9X3EN27_9BACT|nr:hypothetical protein [Nannocystis pusilla]MCY1007073.1 hypothetical protein [Nannocystis pusilla]